MKCINLLFITCCFAIFICFTIGERVLSLTPNVLMIHFTNPNWKSVSTQNGGRRWTNTAARWSHPGATVATTIDF